MKNMIENNMIYVDKDKEKTEIRVNLDIRKWSECYDIVNLIKSIKE